MSNGKFEVNALGVFLLAYTLVRVEWSVAISNEPGQIISFMGEASLFKEFIGFEDIGLEAERWSNDLSASTDEQVTMQMRSNLRSSVTSWQTRVRERLQDFYIVRPRTKIDPKYLIGGLEGFLGEGGSAMLTEIEASDLKEACRCILVGSATAAEHIGLRAAESLLRRWYQHKTGREITRRTWGTVLNRLVKEYPENARPKELILLGYLKLRRDEVAHPDRVSALMDAETTLMNVCNLIPGIASVLAVPTPPLPIPQLVTGAETE